MIAEMAQRHRPRTAAPIRRTVVSGIEVLPIEDDRRPVVVGERTNVIGSKKFRELVVAGNLDQAAEVGRRQVRGGAQILDVCLANPDRDELADMTAFLEVLTRKVKVPLMLDSTDHRVLEEALKRFQGKAVVNSINLEDGEERFEKVAPLIETYGAAVVVGCIDEDKARGMAVTRERKLAIAERSHRLLTEKYGVPEEDIVFDALVFPVGTGDQTYVGAGAETVEGVRLIKEALPRTKTILGISNVSFGLPAAGREILNSVFLHHCVRAGLDLAIVNAEKLERYPSIPEEERRLAEDLIFWRGEDPVAAFAAHFRGKAAAEKRPSARAALPLDERLARCIIEGSKDGLVEDLALKLAEAKPLDIINGPLMVGMDEVGRLFNANDLIVAEVLQSAEAMKAAVSYLEPFMEKSETATKGTVILATVKGDVHDIGKNLVEIILGNNGFRVINLGIKVPPEDLIRGYREHRPDLIGLSGLLVKSAQQMVVTAEDLRAAGIRCPVLVGGAALSAKFTAAKIAPAYEGLVCYANDAMAGLDLANKLASEETREALAAKVQAEQARLRGAAPAQAATAAAPAAGTVVRHDQPIPTPPDLKRHVIDRCPLEDILPYVNPAMLYGKHLGLRGNLEALLAAGDEKALRLRERVAAVENEVLATGAMPARAVYKFFPVQSEGDAILVYGPGHRIIETFAFPRQSTGEGLCLADFVAPRSTGLTDYVALFAVTCGTGVRELAQRWNGEGRFLDAHVLQALAIEAAEGLAELLHRRLREMWGFPDPPGMTMQERFKARYRGVRVSFGYPACPRLEDQEKLFRLLDVESAIGVQLTEGHMMDPEASVSALVFHHPEARYFVISPGDLERFERALAAGG
jgi:5-methyltetrahydrofolate--homocysteine methyltransferase